MSLSKSLFASLAALFLVVGVTARSTEAKQPPPPPPPPPTIVAVVSPTRVVASDGTVYEFTIQNQTCGPSLTSAVVFGRFFPGQPVSPISSAWQTGIGLFVSLENGDLWVLNESCCTPCYKTGTYMGNVFTVAGTSAQAPELAPPSAVSMATLRNAVGGAYPNPTHGGVRITYTTAKPGPDVVRVFDASGRLVRTLQAGHGASGSCSVSWDGRNDQGSQAASGAYFYQIRYADGSVGSKSIVLAR